MILALSVCSSSYKFKSAGADSFGVRMFANILSALVVPTILFSSFAQATQVDKRSVGALTPLSAKTTVCNVLDYGAVADNSTDIGPAILSAFTNCAKAGGATIYIPPGSYSRKSQAFHVLVLKLNLEISSLASKLIFHSCDWSCPE